MNENENENENKNNNRTNLHRLAVRPFRSADTARYAVAADRCPLAIVDIS